MRAGKQTYMAQSCFLFFCLLIALTQLVAARTFDDFATASRWEIVAEGGADPEASSVEAVDFAGKRALKVNYRLPAQASGVRFLKINFKEPNLITAPFSFYIYGNNCGKSLRIRALDQSGETFQYGWGSIDWDGEWRKIEFNDLTPGECWGGNNNKKIDGGLSFSSIIIDYGEGEEVNETLYLAQIETVDFSEAVTIEFIDAGWSSTTGIYFRDEGDGVTEFVPDLGGKPARKTDPAQGRHYLYLDVDDTFIYGQDANTILEIEIEYFDSEFSIWGPLLQYCAIGGGTKETLSSECSGTNFWRKAKFVVGDFDFTNRLNGDFRILGDRRYDGGKPLAVHRVAVRKLPKASLQGTIQEGENPLSDVTVTAYHQEYPFSPFTAKTNHNGSFVIEKLPPGNYSLVASKEGYASLVKEIKINEGTNSLPAQTISRGYDDGVWAKLGQYNVSSGLYFTQGSAEGAVFIAEFEGKVGRRSHRDSGNFFMFFDVDDSYLYDEVGPVDLTVTYLDRGSGDWRIDYDAAENNWQTGPEITKTNTGTWKTETVRLPDARFANRANDKDFRLNAKWEADEDDDYFSFVQIQKVPTAKVKGTVRDGELGVALEGATVTLTDLKFTNMNYSAVADKTGTFVLEDVAVGKYRVIVSCGGYGSRSTIVEVNEGGASFNSELMEGFLGFEDVLWPEKSDGASFTIDTATVHSGTGSVKVVGSSSSSQWMCTDPQPVNREQDYELVVWIKTEAVSSDTGIGIGALQITADNRAVGWLAGEESLLLTGGTQSWTRYLIPIKGGEMNPETAALKLYLRMYENVAGTAWFDDVQFNPISINVNLKGDKSAFSPKLGQPLSLDYTVSQSALIALDLLDKDGKKVITLVSEQPFRGTGNLIWDGKIEEEPLADGFYRLRLIAEKGSQISTAFWDFIIDNTGPVQPIITSPHGIEGEVLSHNQDHLTIVGSVKEPAFVKVFRTFEESTEEVKSGETDKLGNFQLAVPLLEGSNYLWVVAYDEVGNPSEASQVLQVNYDPDSLVGTIDVENGDLLSPADGNGVRDSLEIFFHLLDAGTVEFIVALDEQIVFQETQNVVAEQDVKISWDGRDLIGVLVADGIYDYSLLITCGGKELIPLEGQLEIDNTPPQIPLLLTPAEGGKVTTAPQLKWEALSDAAYYLVYLGTEEEQVSDPTIVDGDFLALSDLSPGTYYWQVVAVDQAGNHSQGVKSRFILEDLDQTTFNMINCKLQPNPFTPNKDGRRERLMVSYTLQQPGYVKIDIYNLSGRLVTTVDLGEQAAGDHVVEWDGTDTGSRMLPGGAYLLRLEATNPAYGAPAVIQRPILIFR